MRKIKLLHGEVVLVDNEDYDSLVKYKWRKDVGGYAVRSEYGKSLIYMHRAILKPKKGEQVDHKNANILDNRKGNIRICTSQENNRNRSVIRNKYGYKGVNMIYGKYVSAIKVNGKSIYIGYYNTPEEAAKAYNKKAKELFGTFAHINKL